MRRRLAGQARSAWEKIDDLSPQEFEEFKQTTKRPNLLRYPLEQAIERGALAFGKRLFP